MMVMGFIGDDAFRELEENINLFNEMITENRHKIKKLEKINESLFETKLKLIKRMPKQIPPSACEIAISSEGEEKLAAIENIKHIIDYHIFGADTDCGFEINRISEFNYGQAYFIYLEYKGFIFNLQVPNMEKVITESDLRYVSDGKYHISYQESEYMWSAVGESYHLGDIKDILENFIKEQGGQ